MNIDGQLDFSVLCAPIAATDRRVLSQAWYSALYRAPNAQPGGSAASRPTMERPSPKVRNPVQTPAEQRGRASVRRPRANVRAALSRGVAAAAERRSQRSPLARKIVRAFADRRNAPRRAAFEIDGTKARVQILIQTHRSQLRLIAICPRRAEAVVAAALAQARFALAARGIQLDAQTRAVAAC